jgi:hypothetical protein
MGTIYLRITTSIKIIYDRQKYLLWLFATQIALLWRRKQKARRNRTGLPVLSNGIGRRDLLDVPRLDGAAFPSGQYLLHSLAKKAMPVCDPLATPPEEKIQLHGFTLYVRPIVFCESWYLRGKGNAVFANLVPQLVQAEIFDLLIGIRTWKAVGAWRSRMHLELTRKGCARNN